MTEVTHYFKLKFNIYYYVVYNSICRIIQMAIYNDVEVEHDKILDIVARKPRKLKCCYSIIAIVNNIM